MQLDSPTLREILAAERTPQLLQRLLTVWEASVRATHLFLSDAEILRIKAYVPDVIRNTERLIAAFRTPDEPIGFLGTNSPRLEMLFLTPDARGHGLGRRLMHIAVHTLGVRELTVNEQNPQAVGFYTHLGFRPFRRTDLDEEGNPYPLLYMRL